MSECLIGIVHISGIFIALLLVPKLEAFGFKPGFEIADKLEDFPALVPYPGSLPWHRVCENS